ncbi:MAG: hypothetical protein RR135_02210 [Oscillospiraceae bacterium]
MIRHFFLATGCTLLGVLLLLDPARASAGVMAGASVWFHVLLPSLFPFMALAGFVALSGMGRLIALPLRPLTRLLRLPDELGATLLASFVGGYPTGARTLSTLVAAGRLGREDAARLLLFCINPGPAFLVAAVGKGMLGSASAGWLLLLAQTLSSLTIALWVMWRGGSVSVSPLPPMGYAEALVTAVSDAAGGMLSVGGYVLLFSALSALITPLLGGGLPSALLTGLFEVTAGCSAAAQLGGRTGTLLIAFLIGFSGLSVLCQALALVFSAHIVPRGLLRTRLVGGLLCALCFRLLLRLFGTALPVMAGGPPLPIAVCSVNRLLGALCVMGMIFMLFTHRLWEQMQGNKL